jgi:pyruvate dehydrogenase E1 component alpha subunit
LDHRGTAALLLRGVDPILILRELLGRPDGLCGGMGGHMHLYAREQLAASSGIIGATGPAAIGFALAARALRPGTLAVAFFGEGALNQGMLLEALNLAAAWALPVLFVCKDDGWSITTASAHLTGGTLGERARGLGVPAIETDGRDVALVWAAAEPAIARARAGGGPTFLQARCVHLEGHFLGDPLLRATRDPLREMPSLAGPLVRALARPGGAELRDRLAGVWRVSQTLTATLRDPRRQRANDPLVRTRAGLMTDLPRLQALEADTAREIDAMVASAIQEDAR